MSRLRAQGASRSTEHTCVVLQGDIHKVRTAILVGVAVPLLMFLAWDAAILGSAGTGGPPGGGDPLAALRLAPSLAPLIDSFSLLAIATSYIGFVLGLTDFLSDFLQARPTRAGHPPGL